MQREGKEVSVIRKTMPAQQGHNAHAMLVMVPAQQGQ
jgi:hypothetical protein